MGSLCEQGKDGRPDYGKAVYWYRRAIGRGDDGEAQFRLGKLYEQGLGVERNLERAKELYTTSAQNGYSKAKEALESLKHME